MRHATMRFWGGVALYLCSLHVADAKCADYVSNASASGIAVCDPTYEMPFAFAAHVHVVYDSDNGVAVYSLQQSFKQYFGGVCCLCVRAHL